MLLGVVLHALLLLMPDPGDRWPVQDAWAAGTPTETNPYVHLYLLIHGMRMPVFFLLAGFFTAMLWQSRGLRAMATHRLKRIGLPLALGAVTVVPISAALFAAADPAQFDGPGPLDWPFAWLDGLFHLWFLWQLLLLMALFVVLVRLGATFVSPVWLILPPLSVLGLFLMDERIVGPDTSESVFTDPVVVGFYATFFLFGAFFHQRGFAVRRWWAFAILPAVALAYPLSLFPLPGATDPETGQLPTVVTVGLQSAGWAATALFQAVYAWLMSFGAMGLFHAVAARERPWLRYMSDASYWLFLAHLPLVVAAQWLLADAAMNPHLKFAAIFIGAVALLLAVYQTCVRYTWLGAMLNGRRSRPRR